MARLKIREYGDPVLRKTSTPVERVTEAERKLAEDMIETMFEAPGVGLAAPQVGVNKRIIVINTNPHAEEKEAKAFINPEIVYKSDETDVMEEGCLSIPEFNGEVKRASFIKVKAMDINGKSFEFEADNMQSRIIQHEIDHLEGVLFVDRMSMIKRDFARRKLNRRLVRGEFKSVVTA